MSGETITPSENHRTQLLQLAMECGALRFGDFKLKSGRRSPYFFDAGQFLSGGGFALKLLGDCYVQAVIESGIHPDVLFGPAYKGIPLATIASLSFAAVYSKNVPVAFNRKVAKDHGEGGVLSGACLEDRRVLVVDDVITAGTALKESADIIRQAGGVLAGLVVILDRQERAGDSDQSAVQQARETYGIPVVSIISFGDILNFVREKNAQQAEAMEAYWREYGVQD